MNFKAIVVLVPLCLAVSACTKPGETTGVGAAAGGVLGAGLGAIVGNQTGDPGSGLVIGAIAGASAGAAVGNAIQAQQEAIRTQDEAIERQEKIIRAQNAELQELRSARSDLSDSTQFGRASVREPAGIASDGAKSKSLAERDITKRSEEMRGSLNWSAQREALPIASSSVRERDLTIDEAGTRDSSPRSDEQMTPECRSAFDEALAGKRKADVSERLFHYRRALRLCPSEPAFHNGLGEVYLSLNRKADAEYEFREALKLDPEFAQASRNMQVLER